MLVVYQWELVLLPLKPIIHSPYSVLSSYNIYSLALCIMWFNLFVQGWMDIRKQSYYWLSYDTHDITGWLAGWLTGWMHGGERECSIHALIEWRIIHTPLPLRISMLVIFLGGDKSSCSALFHPCSAPHIVPPTITTTTTITAKYSIHTTFVVYCCYYLFACLVQTLR
jgi:hypothetical protein